MTGADQGTNGTSWKLGCLCYYFVTVGGFALDLILGYCVRMLVRAVKVVSSHGWPESKATVMSSNTRDTAFGPVAEVYYKYSVNGLSYADVCTKPFISDNSAKYYAQQFPSKSEITIRVNPRNPSTSIACI